VEQSYTWLTLSDNQPIFILVKFVGGDLMKQFLMATLMGVGLLAMAAGQANADSVFDLAWSGAALGNGATATGTITLNLADITNPGLTLQNSSPFVTDFSITVAGASSGNGTFNFADFNGSGTVGGFYMITGGTLDFTSQLVGQSTPGGPWGSTHDSTTGDFNIFSNFNDLSAPVGTTYFTLTTDGGREDPMYLTSFAPASVPEPSSAIPLSIALLGVAFVVRRRQAVRNS
jgi:hypothetical protein